MRHKKLTAFTLSELMVVLIVSSIVVTIAFFALSSVQKQIRNIQKTYEIQQEIQFIESRLWGDMNSHQAYYIDEGHQLLLTNLKDTLQYYFTDKNIIRDKDTISLKSIEKKLYLSGEAVKGGFIDAIELNFSNTFSTHSIFIYKINDAAHYLEN